MTLTAESSQLEPPRKSRLSSETVATVIAREIVGKVNRRLSRMRYGYLIDYVIANYLDLHAQLTDAQYEQIAWVDNTHQTNEMAVVPSPPQLSSIQQRRILARLNCLHLLRQGNDASYVTFTQAQKEELKLAKEQFDTLSVLIRDLTPMEYDMLWLATTTAVSVTASQAAKEADPLHQEPSFDAVNFLAETMTKYPRIYPAAVELFAKYSPVGIEDGFSAMFATGQLRHMMYTEGGPNMFEKLKQGIQTKTLDDRSYNLWFAYWLIDITGFRGHLDSRGSLYLDKNTFQVLLCLKSVLDEFRGGLQQGSDPSPIGVLRKYLAARAAMVGLVADETAGLFATETPRLILARIAAMLRLFTPEEGCQLQAGLSALQKKVGDSVYRNLIAICDPLRDSDEPTPTFGPALFSNLKEKVGIAQAVEYALPIYATALSKYGELRKEEKLPKDLPLNLNSLASKTSIENILAGIPLPEIEINPKTGQAQLTAVCIEHTLVTSDQTLLLRT